MSIEAMKLALAALKSMKETLAEHDEPTTFNEDEAIKSLEEALKQEQGEPDYWLGYGLQAHTEKPFEGATPLYTTPQQRTWVGLTDDECRLTYTSAMEAPVRDQVTVCRAIEAKLKELNT